MGFECGLIWLSGVGRLGGRVCEIRPCLIEDCVIWG